MATYNQWRRIADDIRSGKRKPRHTCYATGSGQVTPVLDGIVRQFRELVSPTETVTLAAADTPFPEVEDYLRCHVDGTRFALIPDGGEIADHVRLAALIRSIARGPGFLAIAGGETKLDTTNHPHHAAARDAGHLVGVAALEGADAGRWVLDRVGLDLPVGVGVHAHHRAGSLTGARDATAVMAAAARSGGFDPSALTERQAVALLDRAVADTASTRFAEALTAGDAPGALAGSVDLPPDRVRFALAQVEVRLDVADRLHRQVRDGTTVRSLCARSTEWGVPVPVVREVIPHARYYDPDTVAARREALAGTVALTRRPPVPTGALETLVAEWVGA